MFETHPPFNFVPFNFHSISINCPLNLFAQNVWDPPSMAEPVATHGKQIAHWRSDGLAEVTSQFHPFSHIPCCCCWCCSFQVCSAHSDQLDLPGQGARLIVRLLFGFSDSVKPKKNVSSSNYYLNFYWFCQTQPKYQQILDLTRWLGRWTIRRRWLQAFNGLPSMKIPFQVLKYLTKFENTLPCTCDRFVWIICSLTLGFMRCREWEKKTSIDLEVILLIFDTQISFFNPFGQSTSTDQNSVTSRHILSYLIHGLQNEFLLIQHLFNDPMIQWSNNPMIQSSNHPGLILAYLTDALGSAFTPAMRSAIIISYPFYLLFFT